MAKPSSLHDHRPRRPHTALQRDITEGQFGYQPNDQLWSEPIKKYLRAPEGSITQVLADIPGYDEEDPAAWDVVIRLLVRLSVPTQLALDIFAQVPSGIINQPEFCRRFFAAAHLTIDAIPLAVADRLDPTFVEAEWAKQAEDSFGHLYISHIPWRLLSEDTSRKLLKYIAESSQYISIVLSQPDVPWQYIDAAWLAQVDTAVMDQGLSHIERAIEGQYEGDQTQIKRQAIEKYGRLRAHVAQLTGQDIPPSGQYTKFFLATCVSSNISPAELQTVLPSIHVTWDNTELCDFLVEHCPPQGTAKLNHVLAWHEALSSPAETDRLRAVLHSLPAHTSFSQEIITAWHVWLERGKPNQMTPPDTAAIRQRIIAQNTVQADADVVHEFQPILAHYADRQPIIDGLWVFGSQRYSSRLDCMRKVTKLQMVCADVNKPAAGDPFAELITDTSGNPYGAELLLTLLEAVTYKQLRTIIEQTKPPITAQAVFATYEQQTTLIRVDNYRKQTATLWALERALPRQTGEAAYDATVTAVRQRAHGLLRSRSAEIRQLQHAEYAAIAQTTQQLRSYLHDHPAAQRQETMAVVEEWASFQQLSDHARVIVQQRIASWISRRASMDKYYSQYQHNPAALLRQLVTVPPEVTISDIRLQRYRSTLVFVLDPDAYLALEKRDSSGRALNYVMISELNNCVVLIKGTQSSQWLNQVLEHENRHQEDRYFFNFNLPIEAAKTEILACMQEGITAASIVWTLTDENGLYNYWADVRKGTTDPQLLKEYDQQWRAHCRRVQQLVQHAFASKDLDKLAAMPVIEWGRRLRSQTSAGAAPASPIAPALAA